MGLSWNQSRLLGGFNNQSLQNNTQSEKEKKTKQLQTIENQLKTLRQRLNSYPKNGRFDSQISATQKTIKNLEEARNRILSSIVEPAFNAFEESIQTPTAKEQSQSIPTKDISNETILANTGVVINKPQTEDTSKETTTNNATDTTKTEQQDTFETKFQEELEKATLEVANARKTMIKASELRHEAVQKLNAFASANNFPRSTVGLGGLSGSQIRFEDLRAGNLQNLAQARQNNTPEYQTYQTLEKDIQEATKAVELAEENYIKSQELREELKGLEEEEKQDIAEKIKLKITKLRLSTENTFNAFE